MDILEFLNENMNYILFFLLIFIILSILFFIIVSYFFIQVYTNISKNYIHLFNNQYNEQTQQILNKYGDCTIKKMYIIHHPFNDIICNVIDFLLNKSIFNDDDITKYLYHSSVIFEIKTKQGIKFILLDKMVTGIYLYENFLINTQYNIKSVSISKYNYTLNYILKTTQKRIGDDKFFNWNIYENCQEFIKEILYSIDIQYNIRSLNPTHLNFSLHFINCIMMLLNIMNKYVVNINFIYRLIV
jgi:hypothetical protein